MLSCYSILRNAAVKCSIIFMVLLMVCFSSGAQVNFSISNLTGLAAECVNPTTLQFGPDGRLYVGTEGGRLFVYNISKTGSNSYAVTASETIYLVAQIPNHNDDGNLYTGIFETRQVTGMLVAGTAANPVIYVSSSDPRVGGGGIAGDVNLDTNSGIVTRLFWNGSAWEKVDIVRGLPRSEENHSVNGMQLDPVTNTLYLAVGGITNAGAPSVNFAYLTEYALSAAIVSIDLDAINSLPVRGSGNNKYIYDLPTLNDPSRTDIPNPDFNPALPGSPATIDERDPFGGNDGLNQAKIVPGGPVQIYSPGYRNAYDILITKTAGREGRMYTIDNGANIGWGGYPVQVNTPGITNEYDPAEPGSEPGAPGVTVVNNLDNFHLVSKPGMAPIYGGHPNPVRANPDEAGLYWHDGTTGTFSLKPTDDWPPVPTGNKNPVEANFLMPGVNDGALATFTTSTNGIAEYTSNTYFNGALTGDIFSPDFTGTLWKIKLNADGTQVVSKEAFASGFGEIPLDVAIQGTGEIFDGTIWVCDYSASKIFVFTPEGGTPVTCTGNNTSTELDDDNDGFSNADETANGTDPCNAVSKPADFDGDKISDKIDTDDDNDGIPDITDKFHLDADNGMNSASTIMYPFLNGNPGTGLFGLGFTGLMSDGTSDPADKYDTGDPGFVMGGAVGLASFPATNGRASLNSQMNGFQFGYKVNAASPAFSLQTSMVGPFFNNVASSQLNEHHNQGVYIGNGDQDNYLMVAVTGQNGAGIPGIRILAENNGAITVNNFYPVTGLLQSSTIYLHLNVNPANGSVQVKYATNSVTVPENVGPVIQLSGNVLAALQDSDAIAVGLIAYSGSPVSYSARYDYLNIITTSPAVVDPIADQESGVNSPPKVMDLSGVFTDDGGSDMLTLSVSGNTNPALVNSAVFNGKTLTLSFATNTTGVSKIRIKATDADGFFAEDEFEMIISVPANAGAIRINAGGPDLTIGSWKADQHFTGGNTYSDNVPVSGTTNDALFQTERWGDFTYNIPVPNGKYRVNLYFAEIFWEQPGKRVFNVNVENGQGQLTNIDIYSKAGLPNTVVSESLNNINVVDGILSIQFTSVVDNAKVNAIEIIPLIPPVITNPVPDQTINMNTATKVISLSNVFSDGGSSNIVLSVTGNSNPALIKSAALNGTTLTLTLAPSSTGTSLIKIRATDADGLFVEDEFKVTVVNPNPPVAPKVVAPIPDQQVAYNTGSKLVSLAAVFSDDKPVTGLKYTVVSNSNTALVKSALISGTNLTLQFTPNMSGFSNIKVRATDADGLFAEDEFRVTVSGVLPPSPPVVAKPLADLQLYINPPAQVLNLYGVFSDNRGVSNLKFSVSGNSNPSLVKQASISGYNLTLAFTPNSTGTAVIKVKATDGDGLWVLDEFVVTVTNKGLLINCGGNQLTYSGLTWIADKYFDDGSSKFDRDPVHGTTWDLLYQTYREGDFDYNIPVHNGIYTVRLHFAEMKEKKPKHRIFSVLLEKGLAKITNLDIYARVGPATAHVETINQLRVTDGVLNISFPKGKDKAVISAIEIIPLNVVLNKAPVVLNAIRDQKYPVNQKDVQMDLNKVFGDDLSVSDLTYTVVSNSNKNLATVAIISGKGSGHDHDHPHGKDNKEEHKNLLELKFAKQKTGTAVIRIRATDRQGLYVEDEFRIDIENKSSLTKTIQINTGGGLLVNEGRTWDADRNYIGGSVVANASAIDGTTFDPLYQKSRAGKIFYYLIPLTPGEYTVRLHFNEPVHTSKGKRIFSVLAENNQAVLNRYDIIAKAGKKSRAVTEQLNRIRVYDGVLNLSFIGFTDNAIISGIEILPSANGKREADLTDLNVSVTGKSALISWDKKDIRENESVSVERSVDGERFILLKDEHTEKEIVESGSFTDRNISEKAVWYRLKIFSEGSVRYSMMKKVAIDDIPGQFLLYPNPNRTGRLYAEIPQNDERDKLHIRIYDLQGRVVADRLDYERRSTVLIAVDLPRELVAGMYLVEVEKNGVRYRSRLVKE